MHTVDISIRCHYYLIITQGVETFLNIERSLKQIELLVLVNHLLGKTKRVEGFSTKREYRLRVDITALGDASAGRITLCNKDTRLFLALVLDVGEMDATVAQLTIVQVSLLGTLTRQFGDTSHCLTLALTFFHLILNDLSDVLMNVQVVINLLFDEVTYIFINAIPVRSHLRRAQLNLCLALEDGFLDVDGDSSYHTCTYVAILVFAKELLDGLGDMFLESTLMRTALRGMLSIDERIVLLAILISMGEGDLDILTLQMNDGIEWVVGHTVL